MSDFREALAGVLRAVRASHQIDIIQGGVGQCWECKEILRVEYDKDGRAPRNPFTEHHIQVQADTVLALLAERLGGDEVRGVVARAIDSDWENADYWAPTDAALAAVAECLGVSR